jgi:hypothetical protein
MRDFVENAHSPHFSKSKPFHEEELVPFTEEIFSFIEEIFPFFEEIFPFFEKFLLFV